MTPSARLSAAIELLDSLNDQAGPMENHIRRYFRTRRYAGSKDRRWVTEFLFQLFRHKGEIDWTLSRLDLPLENRERAMACLLLFQDQDFVGLEEIFLVGPHAQIPLSEVETKAFSDIHTVWRQEKPDWAAGNFPEWLADELTDQYGSNAVSLMRVFQERAPLTIRVNSLKTDRERVLDILRQDDIEAEETLVSPLGITLADHIPLNQLPVFERGLVEIQDEAAQISSALVQAAPGMMVVDYCAGAGGKSLAIAAHMENSGRILAFDVSERRMKDIAVRKRRAAAYIIETTRLSGDDRDMELLQRLEGQAARVFVDAPCSGSGTWRRQPDRKWFFDHGKLVDLTDLQSNIMRRAATLVAPGGRLIYATCSILRQENEERIEAFLATNTEFSVLPVSDIWKEAGLGGKAKGDFLKLLPEKGGADGFFTAILQRAG